MMNNENIKVGLKGEETFKVSENQSAKAKGSGSVNVFSTPDLITEMERVCLTMVEALLDEGLSTVGTLVNVKHIAATPVGMNVKIQGELIELDRRKLLFKVVAFDEKEKIAEGLHERFIIDKEKFTSKAQLKAK